MHTRRGKRRKQSDHYQSALNVAFFCRALLDFFLFSSFFRCVFPQLSFDVKICLQFLNVCRLAGARSMLFLEETQSNILVELERD